MKTSFYFLFTVLLFCGACTSDSTSAETNIKKKGDEDPLVQRYLKDMIANPTTQDEKDRNLIVNFLIDSLWDCKKTASGIYYQIEDYGTGEHPNLNSNMKCHYRGTLLNGQEFDSSYKRNSPLEFTLKQMIAAWQEAIPMLKKGGKGTFLVPSRLAYGNRPMGPIIKPNSVLIFEVEVIDFE